jgi:hypothetical protein
LKSIDADTRIEKIRSILVVPFPRVVNVNDFSAVCFELMWFEGLLFPNPL